MLFIECKNRGNFPNTNLFWFWFLPEGIGWLYLTILLLSILIFFIGLLSDVLLLIIYLVCNTLGLLVRY